MAQLLSNFSPQKWVKNRYAPEVGGSGRVLQVRKWVQKWWWNFMCWWVCDIIFTDSDNFMITVYDSQTFSLFDGFRIYRILVVTIVTTEISCCQRGPFHPWAASDQARHKPSGQYRAVKVMSKANVGFGTSNKRPQEHHRNSMKFNMTSASKVLFSKQSVFVTFVEAKRTFLSNREADVFDIQSPLIQRPRSAFSSRNNGSSGSLRRSASCQGFSASLNTDPETQDFLAANLLCFFRISSVGF